MRPTVVLPGLAISLAIWVLAVDVSYSAARDREVASPIGATRIDETRVAREGIRRLVGRHLVLYTDLASDAEVEALPEVFDQAFPLWCGYFGIDAARHSNWLMIGCVMADRQRFARSGLLPPELPEFNHAYSGRGWLWVHEQATAYYRRHLVLHEGTHGICETILGDAGPPWYAEGVAEMLATHRWQSHRLEMNVMPANQAEVPRWGRIKLIKDELAAGRPLELAQVLRFPPTLNREAEYYAWSWAAAYLLDHDPRFQSRFRELAHAPGADFGNRFAALFATDASLIETQWQVFVQGLEYGYELNRSLVDLTPGKPLSPEGVRVTVAADRGWQNSGVQLEAGVVYRLQAAGQFQLSPGPPAWVSEANGVSIRYYQGRPLGVLLAAAAATGRPKSMLAADPGSLVLPAVIGTDGLIEPSTTGALMLKINESAAELDGNSGTLQVTVTRVP